MQRPLRDYSTPELERLLADIRTAIERAETAEARSTSGDAAAAARPAAAQGAASETEAAPPQEADAVNDERREGLPPPEPVASEPPAFEPPAPEPPASEPPASEPPASEPTASEPTASEPPASEPPAAAVSAPPPIRYMHPSNRNLTWTGEGERPEWVDVYLTLGGSWTALENTAEKLGRRSR